MTDQEIICTFMEPKPVKSSFHLQEKDPVWWSPRANGAWKPILLDLNWLWEVEERLTDEQWTGYIARLSSIRQRVPSLVIFQRAVHATPEQKIKALAAVLRPVVENA